MDSIRYCCMHPRSERIQLNQRPLATIGVHVHVEHTMILALATIVVPVRVLTQRTFLVTAWQGAHGGTGAHEVVHVAPGHLKCYHIYVLLELEASRQVQPADKC